MSAQIRVQPQQEQSRQDSVVLDVDVNVTQGPASAAAEDAESEAARKEHVKSMQNTASGDAVAAVGGSTAGNNGEMSSATDATGGTGGAGPSDEAAEIEMELSPVSSESPVSEDIHAVLGRDVHRDYAPLSPTSLCWRAINSIPICGGFCAETQNPEETCLRRFSNETTPPQPCLFR